MQTSQHSSIFSRYSLNLKEGINHHPLKDFSQIPFIIDILSRKEHHHLWVQGTTSEKMNLALLESIALHVNSFAPKKIRDAEFIYFDVKLFSYSTESLEQIEKDFIALYEEITHSENYIVFAIDDTAPLQNIEIKTPLFLLGKFIKSVLTHEHWRLIVLATKEQDTPQGLKKYFSKVNLHKYSEEEAIAILRKHQNEIENYHNIIIPDEIFSYAYSLSKHYLGGGSHLDNAFKLIDSSAARASSLEHGDHTNHRPILTTNMLTNVVSSWTHIPASHLHHNKFKTGKFIQALQQKIHGQDYALQAIGSFFQSTCIKQNEKDVSIANLLLVGDKGTGKNTCVRMISEYLFGHTDALLQIDFKKNHPPSSLSDVFVIKHTKKKRITLFEAIQEKPYAIIYLQDLNMDSLSLLELFKEVLHHGYAFDNAGNQYDFRHAIFVVTTDLAADQIKAITQKQSSQQANQMMDLMQLVLNENPNPASRHSLSEKDIKENIIPILKTSIPLDLLQNFLIVPFIPLEQPALEKIIKSRLNSLASALSTNFGIELNNAPEVINFLGYELSKQNENANLVEKILEQHVYTCIAHEVLTHIDLKNRPKRLYLLLNDTGNILRCEFVSANVMS